jgi:hypothetical protein
LLDHQPSEAYLVVWCLPVPSLQPVNIRRDTDRLGYFSASRLTAESGRSTKKEQMPR